MVVCASGKEIVPLRWFKDLIDIRLRGDKLERFRSTWEVTLAGMQRRPECDTVETLLLKQIRLSDFMQIEIARYDRHPDRRPHHTHTFLAEAIQLIIHKRRQDVSRKETKQLLAGGGAAMPAKVKEKGKDSPKERERMMATTVTEETAPP